jgi:hypothetical protein
LLQRTISGIAGGKVMTLAPVLPMAVMQDRVAAPST